MKLKDTGKLSAITKIKRHIQHHGDFHIKEIILKKFLEKASWIAVKSLLMKNGECNPKLNTNQSELVSTVSSNTQVQCCHANIPARNVKMLMDLQKTLNYDS